MSVLVVGGATGIGAALIEQLVHERGKAVHLLDNDLERGKAMADHVGCDYRWADASDRFSLTNAIADAVIDADAAADTITDAVYCAGQQVAKPIEDLRQQDLYDSFEVNTFGAIWTLQHLRKLSHLRSAVVVASVAGLRSGGPGLAAYGASKAALIHFARYAAIEWAPDVRVNAACPGWTLTKFNEPVLALAAEQGLDPGQLLRSSLLGRPATTREQAEAIEWLLLDATYMTGQTLVVDGGLTLV